MGLDLGALQPTVVKGDPDLLAQAIGNLLDNAIKYSLTGSRVSLTLTRLPERMLRLLSGREHRVLTAVALKSGSRDELAVNESRVRFRELSDTDIKTYVASGEPTDKAGAYAIQGRAATFISELHGSYTGVMGLPLYETAMLIDRFAR